MKWLRKWRRPDHRWPKYLPGGRFRTSTVAMVIVFAALSWLHQAYQPPTPDLIPEMAVVPPGFVPDPQYTWVPRTNVQTADPTDTTTPTSPTETTSPSETTTPTSPSGLTPTSPTTTVSSDRSGSPSPQTSTRAPAKTSAPATTSAPTTAPSR